MSTSLQGERNIKLKPIKPFIKPNEKLTSKEKWKSWLWGFAIVIGSGALIALPKLLYVSDKIGESRGKIIGFGIGAPATQYRPAKIAILVKIDIEKPIKIIEDSIYPYNKDDSVLVEVRKLWLSRAISYRIIKKLPTNPE